MLNDLRALAIFARIVDTGSIRGAARRLALSPSVVSHHLRALEESVGAALLYRTTRRLSLTPAGEQLAVEAQAMVACAERGLDALRGDTAHLRGALRVTLPGFLAATRLPQDLAAYASAHPHVRLSFSFTEVRHDLLADGFDLAVRIGSLGDSTHQTRMLGEIQRALVAAPSLLQQRKRPQKPADLADWPFVHLGARKPLLQLKHTTTGQEAQVKYEPRVAVDDAIAMRALVLAGAGITTLPRAFVGDDLDEGRAVELLPAWRAAPVPVRVVWPRATVKAALTQHFVDVIGPSIAALFPRR